ncbi:MAG: RsmD family RNA methyltransferase [bacterium]
MRIISGVQKGKRLYPGKGFKARPTTDFAKENLFNVLSNYLDFEDLVVLDLFSGTGSISFEFSSRGSRQVESVEINSRYHAFIMKTSRELGFNNLSAIRTDAFRFLKHTIREYDLIFADPPFEIGGLDQLPLLVFSRNLLKPGGWFILEHSKDHDFSGHARFRELRKYGSVHFSIFVNE